MRRKITGIASAIPLSNKSADRYMLGMMTALIALLLIVVSSASFFQNLTSGWQTKMDRTLTLEIPAPAYTQTLQDNLATLLDDHEAVKNYTTETKENIIRMTNPWLDLDNIPADEIDIPVIVHIQLSTNDEILKNKLSYSLSALSNKIKVSSYQNWFENSLKQTRFLKFISFLIALCLMTVLAMVISLIVRDRILIHREVIALLQTMGAEDSYVRREFYKHLMSITIFAVILSGILFVGFYGISSFFMVETTVTVKETGKSLIGNVLTTYLFTSLLILILTFTVIRITVTNALHRIF